MMSPAKISTAEAAVSGGPGGSSAVEAGPGRGPSTSRIGVLAGSGGKTRVRSTITAPAIRQMPAPASARARRSVSGIAERVDLEPGVGEGESGARRAMTNQGHVRGHVEAGAIPHQVV